MTAKAAIGSPGRSCVPVAALAAQNGVVRTKVSPKKTDTSRVVTEVDRSPLWSSRMDKASGRQPANRRRVRHHPVAMPDLYLVGVIEPGSAVDGKVVMSEESRTRRADCAAIIEQLSRIRSIGFGSRPPRRCATNEPSGIDTGQFAQGVTFGRPSAVNGSYGSKFRLPADQENARAEANEIRTVGRTLSRSSCGAIQRRLSPAV
jgi:hypothetical protein